MTKIYYRIEIEIYPGIGEWTYMFAKFDDFKLAQDKIMEIKHNPITGKHSLRIAKFTETKEIVLSLPR